jgi:hypothetical protein
MPLHNTLKSTPLAQSLDIDNITDLEKGVEIYLISGLEDIRIRDPEFSDMVKAVRAGFLKMAGLGFVVP